MPVTQNGFDSYYNPQFVSSIAPLNGFPRNFIAANGKYYSYSLQSDWPNLSAYLQTRYEFAGVTASDLANFNSEPSTITADISLALQNTVTTSPPQTFELTRTTRTPDQRLVINCEYSAEVSGFTNGTTRNYVSG